MTQTSDKTSSDYLKEMKKQGSPSPSSKKDNARNIHVPLDGHSPKREVQDHLAALLRVHLSSDDAVILDIGCGEGLSVLSLKEAGFSSIDGIHACHYRCEKAAKTGYYREIKSQLLTENIQFASHVDSSYDGIFCVSVITVDKCQFKKGLEEICRITKPGGFAAITVNWMIKEDDLHKVFSKMTNSKNKKIQILHYEQKPYGVIDGIDRNCFCCLIKIL